MLHVSVPAFQSRLENWTSALSGKARLSFGTDYYNELPSAWVRDGPPSLQMFCVFLSNC